MPDPIPYTLPQTEDDLPIQSSDLRALMQQYHDAINAQVDGALADLQQRWAPVRATMDAEITRLQQQMEAALAKGDTLTAGWLAEAQRLTALKSLVEGNVAQFAAAAQADLGAAQLAAIQSGGAAAQDALQATVPPGVNYTFGVPPAAVTAQFAGALQDGSPLAALFATFGPEAAERAGQALFTSIALGEHPRVAAQRLQWATDLPRQRAEVIARTEILRSWRSAQLANYRANSDVVQQWMWSCDFSPRSCGACIALDGTLHSLEEELDDHICGRCSALPMTGSWGDILRGAGVAEEDIPPALLDADAQAADEASGMGRMSAGDWLAEQPVEIQNQVLGPAKGEAWRQGAFNLSDLVGVRHDPLWGSSIQELSLKQMGLDAQEWLQKARTAGNGSALAEASDLAAAQASATSAKGAPPEEGFALREPQTTALSREALDEKSMAELRQLAKDLGVSAARSKAETIDRILAKQAETTKPGVKAPTPTKASKAAKAAAPATTLTPEEQFASLRSQVDERMAQREQLYAQQTDLVAEKDRLLNLQRDDAGQAAMLQRAELLAKQDIYRQSLDPSDPQVKRYLKDYKAYTQNQEAWTAARDEQERLQNLMDRLAIDGKVSTPEYTQARADFDAAKAADVKALRASQKLYQKLWDNSPDVYKPELDSIGGFNAEMRERGVTFTPEQIARNPIMVAAREQLASYGSRIAQIEKDLTALDKPLKTLNKQIERDLKQLRELDVPLRSGAEALDTLRPFSDVIALPEGKQPPNQLMQQLDYKMREPRAVTKSRIIDDIAARLKDNPAWQEYVARAPMPDRLGVYHGYIDWHAGPNATKNAALVADWIKKWGVGYRPGSPEWVAMQMAVRDEFGLDALIHTPGVNIPAGEAYYAENGAAVRALMRAMYDNTQQWFADHGITEIEVYRGFGWSSAQAELIPGGIQWGPQERPNYGVSDLELNPFQSFSADINISQGTGAGNGFAGGGFGGGSDYALLIGAKVPVSRVLGTAQTGFGAKLESEIVVMGRLTDTVSYRASSKIEEALMQQAEERPVGPRTTGYTLADGTEVHVTANEDGTYTVKLVDGQPLASRFVDEPIIINGQRLGSVPKKIGFDLKVGGSKTYKSLASVDKFLKFAHISNTYEPPVDLAVFGDDAAATSATNAASVDALRAQLETLPADALTIDAQDFLQERLPAGASVDLMALDAPTARLVANTLGNLLPALPEVSANIEQVVLQDVRSGALAYVTPDGSALVLNAARWTDLADLGGRASTYAASGWWVAQTPEQILGHEIGHMLQLNYGISDATWTAAMDRVVAAGGDPLVSQYAGDKVEESFAETFALVVYGQPSEAQLPIAREMAQVLQAQGLDYQQLRAAVGSAPLDLG